ncbi:MAG: lipid-A-disaccharide synthase [Flavobacteriales bacterium]|nr:lipid-A-disaccharide synthase [Flavobacteriales bacterium]
MPEENPKIFIIAGEASGDLHASNLVKELRLQSPGIQIEGWGGELMESSGVRILKHYRSLAFMGFAEVIMNIRTILRNFKLCKGSIEAFKPDALVLIDYPGFNLRMAEWAKQRGIKVFYYISPQIWAWKEGRVHTIGKSVDKMYCVLPFEKDFYARFGYEVDFVGHPLLDVVSDEERFDDDSFRKKHKLSDEPIIALLPGSRKQEILTMLPVMLAAARKFDNYQIVIAAAPSQDISFYNSIVKESNVHIVAGETYPIMHAAAAGFVTSGTATLESALFGLKQVVCYKANSISYYIARKLIKVKYISLVNLIADRVVVTELIQGDMNPERLHTELEKLLNDKSARTKMDSDYQEVWKMLGGPGASAKTATSMLKNMYT